jgi:hypothetical protein
MAMAARYDLWAISVKSLKDPKRLAILVDRIVLVNRVPKSVITPETGLEANTNPINHLTTIST